MFLNTLRSPISRLCSYTGMLTVVLCMLFLSCTPFKFSTVQIDEATLNSRLDAGLRYLILQPHGERAEKAKHPLQLISYAYLKPESSTEITVERDYLKPSPMAKAISFKGQFFLGNNRIARGQIEALLQDSVTQKRMDYEYINFIPIRDSASGYIVYRLQVVANMQMGRKDPVYSEPCPPANCHEENEK